MSSSRSSCSKCEDLGREESSSRWSGWNESLIETTSDELRHSASTCLFRASIWYRVQATYPDSKMLSENLVIKVDVERMAQEDREALLEIEITGEDHQVVVPRFEIFFSGGTYISTQSR